MHWKCEHKAGVLQIHLPVKRIDAPLGIHLAGENNKQKMVVLFNIMPTAIYIASYIAIKLMSGRLKVAYAP